MALKGLTPEQLRIDADLRAVNRKLVTYAREFGTQSVQYGELESLVLDTFTGKDQIRKNAAGITQIARNRKQINVVSAGKTEQAVLKKLRKKKSVKEIKQGILEKWAERETADSNMTPEQYINEMSQAEIKDVVSREISYYKALQTAVEQCLDKIYDKNTRKTPAMRSAVEHMKKTSRGFYTDRKTLEGYFTRLTSSLKSEGAQIASAFYKQIGTGN